MVRGKVWEYGPASKGEVWGGDPASTSGVWEDGPAGTETDDVASERVSLTWRLVLLGREGTLDGPLE